MKWLTAKTMDKLVPFSLYYDLTKNAAMLRADNCPGLFPQWKKRSDLETEGIGKLYEDTKFIDDAGVTQAGQAFRKIHDLCWKADAFSGGRNWQAMKRMDKREALADVLREIKDLDQQATTALKSYIDTGE